MFPGKVSKAMTIKSVSAPCRTQVVRSISAQLDSKAATDGGVQQVSTMPLTVDSSVNLLLLNASIEPNR